MLTQNLRLYHLKKMIFGMDILKRQMRPMELQRKPFLVMAQAYRQQYGMNIIYLLPVNLYGPGDNFDLESSHVIPAFVRKFTEAVRKGDEAVTVWGTGKASREFLYVEDAAEGIIAATEKYDKPAPVNLGSGKEITIKDLVILLRRSLGLREKLFGMLQSQMGNQEDVLISPEQKLSLVLKRRQIYFLG